MTTAYEGQATQVVIPVDGILLDGELAVPDRAQGLVLFAHGSGSSRKSPRNQAVASLLQGSGMATLLFDLLTPAEEHADEFTGRYRFDIPFLAERLVAATEWALDEDATGDLPVGYFGASTGAAAALVATAQLDAKVQALVSRGGRPDLAGDALDRVHAPTLLIVGGRDEIVLGLNFHGYDVLHCCKRIEVVPNATHLFAEPGAMLQVSELARDWFTRFLVPRTLPS